MDIPMEASYGQEVSNLRVSRVLPEFLFKHARNFMKRIFYNYYLRDMSIGSIELPVGFAMFLFGVVFGGYHWAQSITSGVSSSSGTVMLSALPVIIGLQLMLAFLGHDIQSVPSHPFHRLVRSARAAADRTRTESARSS
jgi:dolichol-phosphate mannosyltransferase